MKILVALSVMVLLQGAAAVTHSLQYFYIASSGMKYFPEFVTVGMVDGQPFSYYDSVIKKEIPKQDWIAKNEGPEYWERQTQKSIDAEQTFKVNIGTAKERFNQTGGVHLFQNIYGCEWDDETNKVKGYDQYGYDGEDFIAFNAETETWIAPKPEGVISKNQLENDKIYAARKKNYYFHLCPEGLKKYLKYGRSSLMRKALPSVSLLQKTPSSPVICHATGFYPDRAMMFWRKDGKEIHEGVERGEILPNHDGSFQMNVDLDVSSVLDWRRYDCVFQLSGVEDDIITRLDKNAIRSNEGNSLIMIIAIVVAAVILVAVVVLGFIVYKKRTEKQTPSPAESREVQMMMPQA